MEECKPGVIPYTHVITDMEQTSDRVVHGVACVSQWTRSNNSGTKSRGINAMVRRNFTPVIRERVLRSAFGQRNEAILARKNPLGNKCNGTISLKE